MTKNACFVPALPGTCRAVCQRSSSCAGMCRDFCTFPCAGTHNEKITTPIKNTISRVIGTRHARHTTHTPGTYRGTYPARQAHPRARASYPLLFIQKKKMDEKSRTRTIRCTPDNARDMQQMVKQWPELHALVQDLQAQGVFPGLRGLSVTLTGPELFLSKGVAAVNDLNAPKRD